MSDKALSCLVADDHPALLQALVDWLEGSGLDVVATAADGADAVEQAAALCPDVALVDLRMPKLGGAELLERLRDAAPATRVLVYTADADDRVVHTSLAAGAAGILLKEAPLAEVTRALVALAAGSTYLDAALASAAIAPASAKPLLTEREVEVLRMLADGHSHDEIGCRLSISGETVRTHARKAADRLDASTRTHAVATALRLGLIS